MGNVKPTIRGSARDVISDLAPPPQWIEPELRKLVTRIPAGDNWAHEIKFDGFRMHARNVSGRAALLTRNGLDWTAKYPDIAAAIGAFNCRQAYLDGELCAVRPDGTTAFAGLQGHGGGPTERGVFRVRSVASRRRGRSLLSALAAPCSRTDLRPKFALQIRTKSNLWNRL